MLFSLFCLIFRYIISFRWHFCIIFCFIPSHLSLLPFVYLFLFNYSTFSTWHAFIYSSSTRFTRTFVYLFLIIFSNIIK
jgi:hypothetical protein